MASANLTKSPTGTILSLLSNSLTVGEQSVETTGVPNSNDSLNTLGEASDFELITKQSAFFIHLYGFSSLEISVKSVCGFS